MENNLLSGKEDLNQEVLFNNPEENQYKVLARKYRPKDFSELKGQDILVRTITNSIKFNRLPHAFLLTGIRGIGKTTTARIIAKTINCTNPLNQVNFLIPCNQCINCKAFAMQKHPDYIEIDAASKTGVSDIREIIENSRYLPQISKYKIYVIDEVHMLSINAFNALLKTLEEPPKHIIFIFATTESQKIPLTIISRCQRFDLKMFSQDDILILLKNVLSLEKYEAEDNALRIIAKSASGSVRDALSILDQAINNSTNRYIVSNELLNLLSITSKESSIELLDQMSSGLTKEAIKTLNKLYYNGIDFNILLNDLLELINLIIRYKNTKSFGNDTISFTQEELQKLQHLSETRSFLSLSIIWQFIIKSITELNICSNNYVTLEMLIYKSCFIAKDYNNETESSDNLNSITEPAPLKPDNQVNRNISDNKIEFKTPIDKVINLESSIESYKNLLELFVQNKELILYHHLYEDVGLISIEDSTITLKPLSNLPKNFISDVKEKLNTWTNSSWNIVLSETINAESLLYHNTVLEKQKISSIIADNKVQDVLSVFKDAKITSIKGYDSNNI